MHSYVSIFVFSQVTFSKGSGWLEVVVIITILYVILEMNEVELCKSL